MILLQKDLTPKGRMKHEPLIYQQNIKLTKNICLIWVLTNLVNIVHNSFNIFLPTLPSLGSS